MAFFTADGAVLTMGATYLMIDALALYAYVILFVNVAALQGMKRPMFSPMDRLVPSDRGTLCPLLGSHPRV